MITSSEITEKITTAIRQFGEYSLLDKGAHEVIDIDSIIESLRDMTERDILKVLTEVSKTKFGPDVLTSIVHGLDGEEGEKWDNLFGSPLFREHY